jgi:hypothetical protein
MSDDEPKNTEPRNLLDVLDTLVAERGGADCFSAVQMMSARALVRCLGAMCNGDMVRAGSIEVLERMLPPKVDASSAPMDLEKLSDRELGALQRLIEIADVLAAIAALARRGFLAAVSLRAACACRARS